MMVDSMDVFASSLWRGKEGWWRKQPSSKCCPNCSPNCGTSACCDTAKGYECIDASGQGSCALAASPDSESCLKEESCLPLGGYNVWSILGAPPAFPLPASSSGAGRGIILVAVRMDASGLFLGDLPGEHPNLKEGILTTYSFWNSKRDTYICFVVCTCQPRMYWWRHD